MDYKTNFNINVTDENGEKFIGQFQVKQRLSHKDRLAADQKRRDILGPQTGSPSERAEFTSEILSQLWVRVVSSPTWWTGSDSGMDLTSDIVITEVYKEALKAERDHIEELKKKAEEASGALKTAAKEEK